MLVIELISYILLSGDVPGIHVIGYLPQLPALAIV
jgi:hypothetical protein